jgi:hypothetical protein
MAWQNEAKMLNLFNACRVTPEIWDRSNDAAPTYPWLLQQKMTASGPRLRAGMRSALGISLPGPQLQPTARYYTSRILRSLQGVDRLGCALSSNRSSRFNAPAGVCTRSQ